MKSIQKDLSLKFLNTTGLIPVRVDYGQKRPPGDWNPKMIEGADHSVTLRDLETGQYNVGALFSGPWVDIDVDNSNPFVYGALDYFLPPTNLIWGRPSKPRSHRAYRLFDDFDRPRNSSVLRYIKGLEAGSVGDDSYSIEVRGGESSAGMFTVLPGSWRADAEEEVTWDEGVDMSAQPSYTTEAALLKSLRLAVAAAVVAPHWLPGQRNDMSLALAGLLYRIRIAGLLSADAERDDQVEDDNFVLTERDAVELVRCICELAGDTHGDEFTREQNLKNTWAKMSASEGEAKTMGGKALAGFIGDEYGNKVVKALYRLLSDSDAAEKLEKALERYVMWVPYGTLIDLTLVKAGHPKPVMRKEQANGSMSGDKVSIGGKNVSLANVLFTTGLAEKVYGLTFDPTTDDIKVPYLASLGNQINMWRGFELTPAFHEVPDANIQPFLTYIKEVIASGDEEAYGWVLDWLADILQDPGHKPGTALVVVGEQGAGKSFLGQVMRDIIGKSHSGQTNKIDNLVRNFNSVSANKIFMQCDEASHSGSRVSADALKSLITDETMLIEPKGLDQYEAPNHMRLFFTSNRENTAVFIDGSAYERRYTVLHVNPKRAKDTVWWEGFRAWVDGNLPQIMRWLLDRKYDKKRIRRPYETAAKRLIQVNGLEPQVSYVLERLDDNFPISEGIHNHWFTAFNSEEISQKDKDLDNIVRDVWPDRVLGSALEEDYRRWVRGRGHSLYGQSIHKLKHAFGITQAKVQHNVIYEDEKTKRRVRDRPYFYVIPDKETIMKGLISEYGDMIEELQINARNDKERAALEQLPAPAPTDDGRPSF